MNILFLANSSNNKTYLIEWLRKSNNVTIITTPLSLKIVKHYNPDFIISYGYRHIVKSDIINAYKNKIINLHISYLPWNRGADPNIWSFLDDTPKGVTIHRMDKNIDTGRILVQKELEIFRHGNTLLESYHYLCSIMEELFVDTWDKIKNNQITSIKQHSMYGTAHKSHELADFKALMGDPLYDIEIDYVKEIYSNYIENKTKETKK